MRVFWEITVRARTDRTHNSALHFQNLLYFSFFFENTSQILSLSSNTPEGVLESLKPRLWYQIVKPWILKNNFLHNIKTFSFNFHKTSSLKLQSISYKIPRSHIIKIPCVCTDQAGAFPRSSPVPETNNTNSISTKLSEFPNIPHITHISHSRL